MSTTQINMHTKAVNVWQFFKSLIYFHCLISSALYFSLDFIQSAHSDALSDFTLDTDRLGVKIKRWQIWREIKVVYGRSDSANGSACSVEGDRLQLSSSNASI